MPRIRQDNLQKERQDKARKERKKSEELESLYTRIKIIGGLWKTEESIDEELAKLTSGRRVNKNLSSMRSIHRFTFGRRICVNRSQQN